MPYITAVLDANVLHPMVLCDLLIRLAQRGRYRALWTREILAEVARTILRRRPDLSVELLRKRTAAMQAALQDAMVEDYEHLVPALGELGADAHVAAAAICAHADVIVTSNVRDFPEHVLERYGLSAQPPDDFLIQHWWLDPVAVAGILLEQARGTTRPPLAPDDILTRLIFVAPTFVNSILTDVGAAVARRVGERLNIGLRVTATHLELEALHRRNSAGERIELETGSASGDTRVTASLGLLYEAGAAGRLRLGAVLQPGASYTVERTASRPSLGGIDQGSLYELRAPGLVAVGAAFRVNRHLQLSSQLDYVRYSEIEAFVRPGGAPSGGYAIPNGVEPRFAIEASVALGGASVQLRVGVHIQAPGSFVYSGPDANEAAAFRGSTRRVIGAAGGSLLLVNGLALDVAGTTGGDRSELVAGARFRF